MQIDREKLALAILNSDRVAHHQPLHGGEMTDDFSNHPTSIGEARAMRDRDGGAWTPREALVHMLRLIDSGEASPDVLTIIYREPCECGGFAIRHVTAARDGDTMLGMLTRMQHIMIEEGRRC